MATARAAGARPPRRRGDLRRGTRAGRGNRRKMDRARRGPAVGGTTRASSGDARDRRYPGLLLIIPALDLESPPAVTSKRSLQRPPGVLAVPRDAGADLRHHPAEQTPVAMAAR